MDGTSTILLEPPVLPVAQGQDLSFSRNATTQSATKSVLFTYSVPVLAVGIIAIGFARTVPSNAGWHDSVGSGRVGQYLAVVMATLAAVGAFNAFLGARGSATLLRCLVFVIPGTVAATSGVGNSFASAAFSPSGMTPSIPQLTLGMTAAGVLVWGLLRAGRTFGHLMTLITIVGCALTAVAVSASVDHQNSRARLSVQELLAIAALPFAWLVCAVLLLTSARSHGTKLEIATGVMFASVVVSQYVDPPGNPGVGDVRASVARAIAIGAVLAVLVGIEIERRATLDALTRRVLALTFEQAVTLAKIDSDRVAGSRRSHDQRAALLSIEAILRLTQTEDTSLDRGERLRLTTAAAEELTRLRSGYDEDSPKDGSRDSDLAELLVPAIGLARAVGAHVTSDVRSGLVVHVSEQVFADVVRNLILNALQHGGNRSITVSARRSSLEFVELSVSDLGPGVPHARRFDLFEHGRSSGGPTNSGLGLPSARLLLRQIGGDLTLDRSYTNGARFVALIPSGIGPVQEDRQHAAARTAIRS